MGDRWRLPTPVRALPADLVAVAALTVLALLAVARPEGPLRVVLALPLLVFLPGYALLAALFPAVEPPRETHEGETERHGSPADRELTTAERATLAVGLSLAVVPMVGLVLAVSPLSFGPASIALWVGVVTLVCAGGGAVRRSRLPPERRAGAHTRWTIRSLDSIRSDSTAGLGESLSGAGSRRDAVLNVALAAGVVLAVGVTGAALFSAGGEEFTGFYLLSASDDEPGTEYPDELPAGGTAPLVVGVDNHEGEPVSYTVVVQLQEVRGTNGSAVLARHDNRTFTSPTLDSGETWRHPHTIQPTVTGERLRLQYLLYRGSAPDTPTRENADQTTHLWLSVTDTG